MRVDLSGFPNNSGVSANKIQELPKSFLVEPGLREENIGNAEVDVQNLFRPLRMFAWAAFLLASTITILILPGEPRSILEFHAALRSLDTFNLLLTAIGCFIVALIIDVSVGRES